MPRGSSEPLDLFAEGDREEVEVFLQEAKASNLRFEEQEEKTTKAKWEKENQDKQILPGDAENEDEEVEAEEEPSSLETVEVEGNTEPKGIGAEKGKEGEGKEEDEQELASLAKALKVE